ncbi:gustatory receptor 5a for trehalose [Amyelois transitella]|uniref:gustatory receptor 5a for trehalose n=1 Tax=Amyelois transitella TaxID=680683 RepID=UPI00298F99DE|nr:gustatory receptor 5a for trehalose [Amyelois transitella]
MWHKFHSKTMSLWIPTKKNKVHVKEIKPNSAPATFQKSLRATLIMGQLFSLLPVVGIYGDNAANVRFVRTSWKCLYSLLSFCGQVFMTSMCIYKLACSVTSLKGTTPIIFYGTTCITMMMFFHMAKSWPSLVQHIARTEQLDPLYDKTLAKRCNITCFVVLMLALMEHILSLLSAFAETMICHPNKMFYEGFVKQFYPWVFNFIPYSPVLGGFTQFLHFQSTFIWNFSDLFVICMSYYLTSRLQHINEKLLDAQGKYLPESFWKSTREDYCRATQLVRRVDDVISGIIFISFANNLFFICLQLFNTLEDGIKGTGECSSRTKRTTLLRGYEAASYFLFSLVYLISRSIAVSLIASQVNTASTVPAPVLYDVPSPVYCVEVQRFLDQVNGDTVALSGLQFFSVTRGLLLTVAGTIVTYELVMFQFNSPSDSTPSLTNVTLTTPTPSL